MTTARAIPFHWNRAAAPPVWKALRFSRAMGANLRQRRGDKGGGGGADAVEHRVHPPALPELLQKARDDQDDEDGGAHQAQGGDNAPRDAAGVEAHVGGHVHPHGAGVDSEMAIMLASSPEVNQPVRCPMSVRKGMVARPPPMANTPRLGKLKEELKVRSRPQPSSRRPDAQSGHAGGHHQHHGGNRES